MCCAGLVEYLMELTQSPDADVREYATFCLANLASNPDHLAALGKAGAMAPLIKLSSSTNVHSQCLALAALRRMSTHPKNRSILVTGPS